MQCPKCQTEVPHTARFCPECATLLLKDDDIKGRSEVSLEWVSRIFESLEYTTDSVQERSFLARHENKSNLWVGLVPDANLLTVQVTYTVKKPGFGQKSDFYAALNKANMLKWICTLYTNEAMDQITASTAMFICEKTSRRDVVTYLDLFLAAGSSAIENSGLLKYA